MKILITGASGLVGGRLSKFLKQKGYKIKRVSRKKLSGFTKINWDKKEQIRKACKNVDIIINCIGADSNSFLSYSKLKKVNSNIPSKIFEVANEEKVKYFIFLSSFHIYSFKNFLIVNEKNKTNADNFYSKTKIFGEKKLIKYKKKITKLIILRPCNLFGYPVYNNINCWKLLINSLAKNLINKKKTVINSKFDQYRTYSSLESFNYFIFFLVKKINTLKFKDNSLIMNYTTNYNLKISEVIKILLKRYKKSNSFVKFKNKSFLLSVRKKQFTSLYQKRIKSEIDKYFLSELDNLKNYLKK